jgi:hypothetical protein
MGSNQENRSSSLLKSAWANLLERLPIIHLSTENNTHKKAMAPREKKMTEIEIIYL